MKIRILSAASGLLLVALLAPGPVSADPAPKTIGFMGILNSASGQHQNGQVPVTLSLYAAATGGTALWSENQTVTISNGLFSTSLGAVTPFPSGVDFSQAYFVGIRAGSDPEMVPRIPLQGVPYALFAHSVADGSISSSKLASDAASLNKVSGGTMNSVSGNIGIGPGNPTISLAVGDSDTGLNSAGDGALDVYSNNVNTMSVRSGNIGIGISSPGAKLDVANGALRLTNTTDSKKWELNYDSAGGYLYVDEYGVARQFAIKNGGNVGIGTTSPTERLTLNGRLSFQQSAGDDPNAGKLDYRGFDANSLSIVGAGTTFPNRNVRLWDTISVGYSSPSSGVAVFNGNVGIGTSSPSAPLHISTAAAFPASALISGSSTGGTWLQLANTSTGGRGWSLVSTGSSNGEGTGNLLWYDHTAGAGSRMILTNSGQLGIGTTAPQAKLDVRGDIKLGDGSLYADASPEKLRTIRGTVRYDGTIISGSGFTVSRTNFGEYTITFSTAFPSSPSVLLTGYAYGNPAVCDANIEGIYADHVDVLTWFPGQNSNGYPGINSDSDFTFLAIGPR